MRYLLVLCSLFLAVPTFACDTKPIAWKTPRKLSANHMRLYSGTFRVASSDCSRLENAAVKLSFQSDSGVVIIKNQNGLDVQSKLVTKRLTGEGRFNIHLFDYRGRRLCHRFETNYVSVRWDFLLLKNNKDLMAQIKCNGVNIHPLCQARRDSCTMNLVRVGR